VKVSIVVPAFNEEKLIANSVEAIRSSCEALIERGWGWEIIVCDNNSSDRTAELARSAGASVIFEPINQISRARNTGASVATGDWLIFVDADSYPTRRLFGLVAEHIESNQCIGGGCLVRLDQRSLGLALLVGVWNFVSRVNRWAAGSFIFCEMKVFRELHGFSEKLFASEELEFSGRLKAEARRRKKKVIIISKEKLLTSARKAHLYNRREYFRFMARAVLFPRRVLSRREECLPWYDGRR
jgi:glycosyltransferase involved in cell wall biosynthesis